MKKFLIVSMIFLVSCSSSDRRQVIVPATPMPTDELISVGNYSTKSQSYAIAFRQAENFCSRWNAAPSVLRKQVKYNGTLSEDTNTAINTATKIADAAGAYLPNLTDKDAYETTITYKCY